MAFQNRFEGYPILCWAIDDWEQFYSSIKEQSSFFNLQQYLNDYNDNSFSKINLLFDSAPFKLNLGGKTEKSKLVATDKPMGIFDFSLASMGMYKVPEYFSQKLANEYPDKFKDFELPSGVVPPNLVVQKVDNGEKIYIYEDDNGIFDCVIRQKGETAIEDGVKGAKLKYATRNRKVYLTHKRNKGKVKYVEIYSLFYFTSLSGDTQFAIRHIPAMMVADYLESIGVMTRIYMTRFVKLNTKWTLKQNTPNGVELPMYKVAKDKNFKNSLLIQPIIAKDFGQEFDKSLGFMISSDSFRKVYEYLAMWAVEKEVTASFIEKEDIYGQPNFSQNEYFEGIERYRNKYQEYVKLGLFKSKEVLPEAMLFFHDMVIKNRLDSFLYGVKNYIRNKYNDADVLIDININPFFNWWMRLSATILKNKIDIVNSNELRKDLSAISNEVYNFVLELDDIVSKADVNLIYQGQTLGVFFKELGAKILQGTDESLNEFGYSIIDKQGRFTFKKYITNITLEITTYAEGIFFETEEDRQEVRNELLKNVLNELQNF
jgi:hypothetical protein